MRTSLQNDRRPSPSSLSLFPRGGDAADAADAPARRSGAPRSDRRRRGGPPSRPPPPRPFPRAGAPSPRRNQRRRTRCPPRRFDDAGDAPVAKLQLRRHVQVARADEHPMRPASRPGSRWRRLTVVAGAAASQATVTSPPRHSGPGLGGWSACWAGPRPVRPARPIFLFSLFFCFPIFSNLF